MSRWILFFLVAVSFLTASPKHRRDEKHLPKKDQEFAEQLSLRHRKIFCGRFNAKQREMAVQYARGRGKDSCSTPDEAVTKVMEETGMSLAVKGKSETDQGK